MLWVGVSEIHAYPSKPKGYEEPLFPTAASKRALIEHLLRTPWLVRASELRRRTGQAAHVLEEPVELRSTCEGVELVRLQDGRCSYKKRRVVEVLERWREVGEWWDEDLHRDRLLFRVLLSGGAVVDLSWERYGGWFLVGVVD